MGQHHTESHNKERNQSKYYRLFEQEETLGRIWDTPEERHSPCWQNDFSGIGRNFFLTFSFKGFLLAAASSWLGFHYIIGTFVAGLIISTVFPKTAPMLKGFRSFSWGVFLPMFFKTNSLIWFQAMFRGQAGNGYEKCH